MSFAADLKTLFRLTLSPVRGRTHADRMNHFYGDQAEAYDDFRQRLLPGREVLCRSLDLRSGDVWLDLGGGTAQNLEWRSERISELKQVYVVDLAAQLLDVARRRVAERGWKNVSLVEADATTFRPPEPVDVVTFSYSLTMIPDWIAVLEQAERVLKPGGMIGVVDFYVSRKYVDPPRKQHNWFTRTFWPTWFAADNVFLNSDHLPTLARRFKPVQCEEGRAKLPYLPVLRAPYYLFVGRKRTA